MTNVHFGHMREIVCWHSALEVAKRSIDHYTLRRFVICKKIALPPRLGAESFYIVAFGVEYEPAS